MFLCLDPTLLADRKHIHFQIFIPPLLFHIHPYTVLLQGYLEKLMSWYEFWKTLKYYRLLGMLQIDLNCIVIELEGR